MHNLTLWLDRQIRIVTNSLGFLHDAVAGSLDILTSLGASAKNALTFVSVAYIVVVGVIDISVGRGVELGFFYLIGCAFAGWVLGKRAALLCALLSGMFSYFDEAASRVALHPDWVLYWNSAARLLAFATVGWLTGEVGRLTRNLERTVEQRTARLKNEVEKHKETSARLRETLQLFRQVTENITDVFWVTDPAKTRVNYVSPEFEKVWGQPRKNLYTSPGTWLEGVHAEDRERITHATQAKQIAGNYDEVFRVMRPDRSVRWVHERAFPVKDEGGKVYRIVGITEDITDRVRLERQILEISDREQARIGQDIHDGLCQKLISLAFDVNSLGRSLSDQQHSQAEAAGTISELLDETITESRRVARGLYPVRLETEGLVSALEELANATTERFDIHCSCDVNAGELPCDTTVATHLYRIAQEAVNNSIKHSMARNISIQLTDAKGEIELSIADDGVGMAKDLTRPSGMGLHIMDYRARALGGSLRVAAGEKNGTVVLCRVPQET
jgi:PAS domain S-box-containing protein